MPKIIDLTNSDDSLEESYQLSHDSVVETIQFPVISSSLSYIKLEDLQNLKELDIPGECLWLKCSNLPKLQSIHLGGNLKWLVLDGLNELAQLDLSACKRLAMLWIENAPSLQSLNIKGCIKLREVAGLDEATMTALEVNQQIHENQLHSIHRPKISDEMTFSDVDSVLSVINKGAANAAEQELCEYPFHFEIRLLLPLEEVDTGGTGERYTYEFAVGRMEGDDYFSVTHTEGHHTPEACMGACLRWLLDFIDVPEKPNATKEDMLEYLGALTEA